MSHTLSEVPEESCDDEDGDEVGDEAEVNSEDSGLYGCKYRKSLTTIIIPS